jgi:hypothetical protein
MITKYDVLDVLYAVGAWFGFMVVCVALAVLADNVSWK